MESLQEYYFHYQAFGLIIRSDFEIPELLSLEREECIEADVSIRMGKIPKKLEDPLKTGVRFQIKSNQFLMRVDNIAGYYVFNASTIVVETYPGARGEEVRLFLLGSAFGALIHQRRQLPLHAGSIETDDKCVLFCGASGAGKSTITRALNKRGYRIHSDDLCVITQDRDGNPIAYPGVPNLKLWEDSLLKIGESPSDYLRIRETLNKFSVSAKDNFSNRPLSVKKIYTLHPYNKNELEMTKLKGMEKFNALKNQTYKHKYVKFMGYWIDYFKTIGSLINHVSISRIYRPVSPFLLEELADLLEEDFLK